MECVNCAKIGHSFRECREPVMSFGICAVKFLERTPQYLLIRRRDSLGYVEFMRGKYKLDNQAYIQTLLNGMTIEERSRLLASPFDTLWDTLWNNQNTRQYRNEHEHAKRIFEQIKNTGDVYGKLLNSYISGTTTTWTDAEWGFPKGRRSLHESEQSCALREFTEETGFPSRILHVMTDEPRVVEEYTGTNGIPYKQLYYVGVCAADTVAAHQPHNRVMNREVGNIGWFPYADALEKIRPTNPEKRLALERLNRRICDEGLGETMRSSMEWTTR